MTEKSNKNQRQRNGYLTYLHKNIRTYPCIGIRIYINA